MRTNDVEQRAKRTVPVQCVSDTGHKDAPIAVTAYSTAGRRHQTRYPAPPGLPAMSPIPESVETWNVEAHASLAIRSSSNNCQVSFALQRELWESIGRPRRVSVAGDATKGFTITWGGAYAIQSVKASGSVFVLVSPKAIGLPREPRNAHLIRARSRVGVIEIDPPHPLWLANDPAFRSSGLNAVARRAGRRLAANPQSGAVAAKPVPAQSVTAPPPKPRPADLPEPTRVELLKAELKQKLAAAMDAKTRLEQATGLKLKLTAKGGFIVEM
jgi:hypothetical protein